GDVRGDLLGRAVADGGAVVLELAGPGLRDRDRYSDGRHPATLHNPDDRLGSRFVGSTIVSDSFQAALARSAQVEEVLATTPEKLRMLTGDRPTGALHIGHYFGSIR